MSSIKEKYIKKIFYVFYKNKKYYKKLSYVFYKIIGAFI